jgi:hypothetical protein
MWIAPFHPVILFSSAIGRWSGWSVGSKSTCTNCIPKAVTVSILPKRFYLTSHPLLLPHRDQFNMANADPRLLADTMYTAVTDLPPVKRFILTHDEEGKSTVHSSPELKYYGYPGVGGTARSCQSSLHICSQTGKADNPKTRARALQPRSMEMRMLRVICREMARRVSREGILCQGVVAVISSCVNSRLGWRV